MIQNITLKLLSGKVINLTSDEAYELQIDLNKILEKPVMVPSVFDLKSTIPESVLTKTPGVSTTWMGGSNE